MRGSPAVLNLFCIYSLLVLVRIAGLFAEAFFFSIIWKVVAIKQLNPDGCQGNREFIVEVLTLSMADHPNLVKLIGYCVEAHHRVLVYEYMPLGSLEDHLHGMSYTEEIPLTGFFFFLDFVTSQQILISLTLINVCCRPLVR